MAEIWVTNASPLISLARIGRLDLLESLERELLLPEPVAQEILAGPEGDPARAAVQEGQVGRRLPVEVPPDILEWSLGAGESTVIAPARNRGARAVLDDAEGRACARTLGVPVIGTLGVVLRAKNEGRIPSAAAVVQNLRAHGLYVSTTTLKHVLRLAGEEP